MTFVLGSEHGITCASRVCSHSVRWWGEAVRGAVRQPGGGPLL